jgi:hypothetical protein
MPLPVSIHLNVLTKFFDRVGSDKRLLAKIAFGIRNRQCFASVVRYLEFRNVGVGAVNISYSDV